MRWLHDQATIVRDAEGRPRFSHGFLIDIGERKAAEQAMHDAERDLLFVKHAAFVRGGEYPLGTNLCLYTAPDRFMVEMETMGPAITLKPAETLHHTETWVLKPAPLQWPSNDALRRLGLYGTRESMLR